LSRVKTKKTALNIKKPPPPRAEGGREVIYRRFLEECGSEFAISIAHCGAILAAVSDCSDALGICEL